MSLYSVDKLIEETRRIAAEFRATTGTILPVSGEIARYDVAHLLGFELCEDKTIGYDATGKGNYQGQRLLIKSRVIMDRINSNHRIGQINTDADWDLVALSLMDEEFKPTEIYLACREEIEEALAAGNGKRSRRGSLSVAKFTIIGELVWKAEQGLTDNSPVHAGKQAVTP